MAGARGCGAAGLPNERVGARLRETAVPGVRLAEGDASECLTSNKISSILLDMNKNQEAFLKALAKFLVQHEAEMSMGLALNRVDAQRWSALRSTTPLRGYYPNDQGLAQAEKVLSQFLWPKEG